jgi:hypothetical protein
MSLTTLKGAGLILATLAVTALAAALLLNRIDMSL